MSLQKRSKLAFIGFRGGRGGISNVMLNLMNASSEILGSVHLILNNPNMLELPFLDKRVRVINLSARSLMGLYMRLLDYLREWQPDVILTNRERVNAPLTLANSLNSGRTRIVIRVGMPVMTALKRRNPLKRTIRRALMQYSYKRASLIIANSERVRQDILEATSIGEDKVRCLPNPTVSRRIRDMSLLPIPDSSHREIFKRYRHVIVGIGRLARQKGFSTLIRSFKIVYHKRHDACLVIIGEGKERKALNKLISELGVEDRAFLIGYSKNPFSYLRLASCFVLSSRWEGSPNVLIEALSLGIPVVSTDCPTGPREILQDGKFGPLVPIDDHNALSEAILRLLANPPEPQSLKEAVRPFDAYEATKTYLREMGLV